MVAVQVILATLVQRYHAATHGGFVVTLALGGEFGSQSVLGVLESFALQAFGGNVHIGRYVGDLLQLTDFHSGALQFLLGLAGQKSIGQVVFGRTGNLLQATGNAMVIGHHQTALGNKGRRASAQADGCALHMIHPGLVRSEVVAGLELLVRQIVKGPHAFVGKSGCANQRDQGEGNGVHAHGLIRFKQVVECRHCNRSVARLQCRR